MSRSGYVDQFDLDYLAFGRYRGRVASAMRGARGQKLLRDTLAALDAMPEKRLIANELREDGEVCTLGAVMVARGIEPDNYDPAEHDVLGNLLNVSPCVIAEIEFMNDECTPTDPVKRWEFMRREIAALVKPEATP